MATEQAHEDSARLGTLLAQPGISRLEEAAEGRIPGRPGRWARYEPALLGTATVLAFLIAWQTVAALRLVPKLFLPGPLDIIAAYSLWNSTGSIATDLWVSCEEVVLGFLLAVAVGLPFGLLIGWYRRLGYALDPFIGFFNSTPRIALIPIIVIWFGIGLGSKVTIVFISSVIAIIINAQTGVQSLDTALLTCARSFGASTWQVVRTIALPGALPFILAGLRLGIGHALIAMVVAELVAAQAGVGLMMSQAGQTYQTPEVFAGLFVVAGMGVIITFVLKRVERRFQSWRPSQAR